MRGHDDRSARRQSDIADWQDSQGGRSHRPAPGKRTLTERLAERMWPPAPVAANPAAVADREQCEVPRASALDSPGFVGIDLASLGATGAAAAAGVQCASAPLPHADVIQRAFGRHAIGSIRVEVGGAAAASARAIGAAAYAVGDRIAFASAPDLHTAAHEAAHVIQQRAGMVPRGRGTPGDAYEQHADRVADAVVAGGSAEAILDELVRAAGARGAMAAAAVQCRNDGPAAQLVDAGEYLHHNANETFEGIRRHLASVRWPEPHPRLAWRDRGRFFEVLLRHLDGFVHGFQQSSGLAKLLHPASPLAIIDQLRATVGALEGRPVGPTDWRPQVGIALGEALAESMLASLARLGPRWLASARRAHGALDGAFVDVDDASLVTSHPADRVVGRAMCAPGVFDVRASLAGERDDLTGVPDALRPVTVVWQGQRSPRLWNWVKAEPADATAEEVAAHLFGGAADNGEPASFRAYRMLAAPPYFCVPADWAIEFDAAKEHAPKGGGRDMTTADAYAAVAIGAVGDEVALAQAGTPGAKADARDADGSELLTVLEDSANIAGTIASALEAWELAGPVTALLDWIDAKRIEVSGMDAATRGRWASVLHGQKANLSRRRGGGGGARRLRDGGHRPARAGGSALARDPRDLHPRGDDVAPARYLPRAHRAGRAAAGALAAARSRGVAPTARRRPLHARERHRARRSGRPRPARRGLRARRGRPKAPDPDADRRRG